MELARSKPRAWCNDCEAWHPRDEHIVQPASERPPELKVEPRPALSVATAQKSRWWVNLSLFLFVILPAGVIVWSATVYVLLRMLPYIRAAMP